MNSLAEYFKNIDNLSHAFLIGNVVFDEIEKDLTDLIKSKILNVDNLNLKENSDIYYFDEYDTLITKDSIKQLLNNLSTTSQFNNAEIYIINGAERMSDSVYNSMLKTLEEPENNIYAFLITRNIEMIKDTIKSRCQKIFLNSNSEDNYDEKLYNITTQLINNIESDNIKTIANNPKIYTIIEDRITFQKILKIMLIKYNYALKEILNVSVNIKENNEIIKNNDIISLSKKILVIDKFINLLNNYLNKNLTIDRFLIEMWRCEQ